MDAKIIDRAGANLTLEEFTQALMAYDVIFVGEEHDAKSAHEAELIILEALSAKDTGLVLALEMFETDVQDLLSSYLAGEIPEDTFLQGSRPWPAYRTDYRPLVEFAKLEGMPVVAANVPRRAAAAVAKTGDISHEVLGIDSIYLPDTVYLDSEEYLERFAATMHGMPHGSPMGGMKIDALYKSQVLKDAVMASSLAPWLGRRILFFCGRFHSDYHLGIPYQLENKRPDLKIAVVTLASSKEDFSDETRSVIADFLWVYPAPPEE